ncbi:MAG: exodeoxyribonuclease VII large subunit [Kiritimatiellia bacterium]|nr:exodeoxyribonuclease VII large subunit [Kiritimatiellia bacterium]
MVVVENESPKPYTVSSLTSELKTALETRWSHIYLEAEISGWRLYPSGHAYFTLKDSGAQISAVMFKSSYEACLRKHPGIEAQLKDGAKVLVYGKVTVYAPRGNYQLVVLAAKLVGEGDLMQQYLELKAKLEAEGLFDPARKRLLPFMPRRIGLVTSEAGAVIHDMCTVLMRRFPALEIRLYPSLVQGGGAPASIIAGIRYFNSDEEWKADLLIVARGGGSFEDLFCFNDEALVREVAASKIPTISAVGHETDFTLCDFAADKRAGTPSIAAEIAVPCLADLKAQISDCRLRLVSALRGKGEFFAQRVDQLSDALGASLEIALANSERRLARVTPRLEPALKLHMQRAEARVQKAEAQLRAYSPYGVLERGYSLTTADDGSVVKDASVLKNGDVLTTRFAKGTVSSVVA